MDKIYSRKRLKLPIFVNSISSKKIKKVYYFFTLWFIVFFTVCAVMNFISPPFEKLCIETTRKIGTNILNEVSTEVLKNIDYNDLIIVTKDVNEKITMVRSNVVLINILSSDIAYKIQEKLAELKKEKVPIFLGLLTGIKVFSGSGPSINVKILPIGSVITNFKSEFVAAGINQTIHRLYLEVECEVGILTSYGNIDTNIINQVLFAENIIVGEIPDSYYNLEGLRNDDVLEVIN